LQQKIHFCDGQVLNDLGLVACVASVSVGFSARSRRFSLFGGAKIGASATLMEAAGRGRGDEKRKCLAANPMILKNAPLTLSQLDKFTV